MKRFLKHLATVAKWAGLVLLVGFVAYFCPVNGLLLADVLTDDDDDDDE